MIGVLPLGDDLPIGRTAGHEVVVDPDQDHLAEPHVVCQLHGHVRNGIAFPEAVRRILREGALRQALEEDELIRVGNKGQSAHAEELWRGDLLDFPDALLNHKRIDRDEVSGVEVELILQQVDPIEAEGDLVLQEGEVHVPQARPVSDDDTALSDMLVLEGAELLLRSLDRLLGAAEQLHVRLGLLVLLVGPQFEDLFGMQGSF
ncbi:hypothetical protein D3C87_1488020 [compost metagenome]